MTFTFHRGTAIAQIRELPHRTEAAAPLPCPTGALAQFVAGDSERQVALDILDRVVARIRVERVDCIHSVEPVATPVATLEDLHMDPLPAVLHAGEGDHFEIADPGGDLAGESLRQ